MQAALECFAHEGYDAVPTSRIARQAGVSEGLIFRHFESKKGLLEALMLAVERKLAEVFAPVLLADQPLEVIQQAIVAPFLVDPADYDFWRLQFKLKWEQAYHHPHKMQPVVDKLSWAFAQLGYAEPELEAIFLTQTLDTISTSILRGELAQPAAFRGFLLKKYGC